MLDVSAGGAKCTLNQAQADCDRNRDPDPMQSVYDVLSMYIGMYIMYMNVEVYALKHIFVYSLLVRS